MSDLLAETLAWVNVILGVLVFVFNLCFWRQAPKDWRWIKMGYALLGLYWAGLYLFVALTPEGAFAPVFFGQAFVRPAFTLTLTMMAAGAISRWRRVE